MKGNGTKTPRTKTSGTFSDREPAGAPLSRPRRIVVVRALPGLGDFLCAVPAWRALRAAFPAARITLVSLPGIEPLARRFAAYLDDFVTFPGFPGINERPPAVRALPHFLQEMQAAGYDLALQMHGSGGISNLFTMLLGARRTAGFYLPGAYCPDPHSFLPYPEHLPEVWRHLALLNFLGVPGLPSVRDELEFPVGDADRQAYEQLAQRHGLQPGRFACLHPGASTASRRWAAASFAGVGDFLSERGLRVVLTGQQQEAGLTHAVAAHMANRPLDLAGETTLGAMALLLRHARLLVCNDTGVSHLAAATNTPSVVIFLQTDPQRWAPLNRGRHRVVAHNQVTAGPAAASSNGPAPGRNGVPLAAVLRQVSDALDAEVDYAR